MSASPTAVVGTPKSRPAVLLSPLCAVCGTPYAGFGFAPRGRFPDGLHSCLKHRGDVDRAWTYDLPLPSEIPSGSTASEQAGGAAA